MKRDSERLFELLPAIHRLRDAAQGGPLEALLGLIGEQVAVLEEDLAQFYDDQFIETCAEWVVPYLGDLIGYRSLHHRVPGLGRPRAEVANTIGYRRRKGTVAMLEGLARDVTGWPARAVEFFELVQTTQFMNHVRRHNALTPDLRRWDRLEALGTAFDTQAHSVDVRRIASGEGRHNLPNLGIFLWRLGAHRLSNSPAVALDAHRFRFSPLGRDIRLYNRLEPVEEHGERVQAGQVPMPLSRRRLDAELARHYGPEAGLFVDGFDADRVRVCDLSDAGAGWAHTPPPPGWVAVDPVLGRLAFGDPQGEAPRVTFHYGFGLEIGGGEYERAATFDLPAEPFSGVAAPAGLGDALTNRTAGVPVQITDNGRYEETPGLTLAPGERFELRAGNGRRPTLVLGGDFEIAGGDELAEVSLNGLLVLGGTLRVTGTLRRLRLRHCTWVPGLTLDGEGLPQQPAAPGLVVESGGVTVELSHCVIGGIRMHDLSTLVARDSVIDATDPAGVACAGLDPVGPDGVPVAGGTVRLEECTVIGKVRARRFDLVSQTILHSRLAEGDPWPAPVWVERKQTGCVRFSFVPPGSRTPRRYRCQPDLEMAQRIERAARAAEAQGWTLSAAEKEAIRAEVTAWMWPAFTSLRPGDAGYVQLRSRTPRAIREGAEDEAAMGVTHDLFEPQRLTNLRIRLEEYMRFSLEAGVLLAS